MDGNEVEYKKTLYVWSEMVAAGRWLRSSNPNELDTVLLSLKHKEGGCKWEFEIELVQLGGKGAFRLKMFGDSWMALQEAPEVFEVLAKFNSSGDDAPNWQKLINALEQAGWERFKAPPKEEAKPLPCRSCGFDQNRSWKLEDENDMKKQIAKMFRKSPVTNELDISTALNVSVRTAARLVDELIVEGRIPATPASLDRKK